MSAPPQTSGEIIERRDQLVAWFESGSKPRSRWRIGTEHEKFGFRLSDLRPMPYDGRDGIRALLEGLCAYDWEPVIEESPTGPNVIALKGKGPRTGGSITLEPGGQFELSGAPLRSIHETCQEVNSHLDEVRLVCKELGVGMMGLGFNPKWRREDVPWMPKGRYKIMREYMPKKGKLGLDMMLRTCTVQVNLDYADEADMVRKFRVSLALQPIATALFANSPFTEGKPNGFLSFRSHVWTDTDPDRCGMLPFVFEKGFGFERYVDYLLDVPMYFVYRDGRYLDVSGQSFRSFMQGKLKGVQGEVPRISDWTDHTTTAFPEVRLKKFLEMRGADGGPWGSLCALPALWVGLLYDSDALTQAADLVADWTIAEMAQMRADAPRLGLKAPFRGKTLQHVAQQVLAIADKGLERRQRTDSLGGSEQGFLQPLKAIANSGVTPAEELLARFHGPWGGTVDPVYAERMY
ncbi:MAG: glutamate--cysteine ligase [Alphaproteobacteria bacterium]|nr:glutamate--cysteine ligase [Alphaproteobacteria bacterium]